MGTFLVLEPAFRAGKHAEGGGLMAVMLSLFALPSGLEASLVDFHSMWGRNGTQSSHWKSQTKNLSSPGKARCSVPQLTNPLCGDICAARGDLHIAAGG